MASFGMVVTRQAPRGLLQKRRKALSRSGGPWGSGAIFRKKKGHWLWPTDFLDRRLRTTGRCLLDSHPWRVTPRDIVDFYLGRNRDPELLERALRLEFAIDRMCKTFAERFARFFHHSAQEAKSFDTRACHKLGTPSSDSPNVTTLPR